MGKHSVHEPTGYHMPVKSDSWYQYFLGLDNAAQLQELLDRVHTDNPFELIYKYINLRVNALYGEEEQYRKQLLEVEHGSPYYDQLMDGLDYIGICIHELSRVENFIKEVFGMNLMFEFGKKE